MRVVDENNRDLPRFSSGGRSYVLGTVGARYAIVVANPTACRVEAVVSVDGLDAIDGHPANFVEKRGYILPAYGDMTIEGFRTSLNNVATFRFSSVADSYAGRLGQARDVGVIGVAFFPEQAPVAVAPPPPRPTYAPRYRYARARAGSQPSPSNDVARESSSGLAGGGAQPSAQAAPALRRPAARHRASRRPSARASGPSSARSERRTWRPRSSSAPTRATRARWSRIRYNDRAGLWPWASRSRSPTRASTGTCGCARRRILFGRIASRNPRLDRADCARLRFGVS